MLNNFFLNLLLVSTIFGYSVFDHIRDTKIPSSNFISSYGSNINLYNFSNPACNSKNNQYLYSDFGSHFDGILNTQQFLFNLNTKLLNNLNIALLRSSIDDINNTSDAWDDNGDGIINQGEIDYDKISTFNHNTLGLILSKPFNKNNFQLGINSKLSITNLAEEHSFSSGFDFGVYQSFKNFDFGLVIKDILSYNYWTTGTIDNNESSIILGSSFQINAINIGLDLNPIASEYFIAFEYNYDSLVSFYCSNSTFEKIHLGLLINFEKFNIGYSFSVPEFEQLGITQKITLGINKTYFK